MNALIHPTSSCCHVAANVSRDAPQPPVNLPIPNSGIRVCTARIAAAVSVRDGAHVLAHLHLAGDMAVGGEGANGALQPMLAFIKAGPPPSQTHARRRPQR